jgi:hypothetical protein
MVVEECPAYSDDSALSIVEDDRSAGVASPEVVVACGVFLSLFRCLPTCKSLLDPADARSDKHPAPSLGACLRHPLQAVCPSSCVASAGD